jgi:glycosyltransferase involved in cell wall biosynthesis
MTLKNDRAVPRILIISNMPVPYRIPVYDLLSKSTEFDLKVVYLADREPDRLWTIRDHHPYATVLRNRIWTVKGRHIHFPTVALAKELLDRRPDVIIATGYNPSHLLGFVFARLTKASFIIHTDGTRESERLLSIGHRLIRRFIGSRSAAFIGSGPDAKNMYKDGGLSGSKFFFSPLASPLASPRVPLEIVGLTKSIDLLFVGRLEEVKNPKLFLAICEETARITGRKIASAMVGAGSQLESLRQMALRGSGYECDFPGFLQSDELGPWFSKARVFLLTSSWEPWGLVANEAAAFGLPIVTSDAPGAIGNVLINNQNAFVMKAGSSAEDWASKCARLLESEELRQTMGLSSLDLSSKFTLEVAASGIRDAIAFSQRSAATVPFSNAGDQAPLK